MPAAKNLHALLHEATSCHQAGELARAESLYRQMLATHLAHADAHDMQVGALNQMLVAAHCNLAYLLYEEERFAAAAEHFRHALAIEPSQFDALVGLAHASAERSDYTTSADALKKALAIQPSDADLWNDYGNAMLKLEGRQAADAAYLNALALQPDSNLAHYNYANFLLQQNRVNDAADHYRSVLSVEPDHIAARINLASCQKLLGDLDAAVATYRQVLQRSPEPAQNRLNLALTLLSHGNFKEGWPLHEARLEFPSEQARVYPYPHWSGESLAGKTIFIWGERGYGDEIQFVRFLPTLRALGARVIFECRLELHDLLQRANLCDKLVIANSASIDEGIDYQLPLLSLPLLLGIDSYSGLSSNPYLSADAVRASDWKKRLGDQARLRVGLVWAGNPQHQNDARRSIPFAQFSCVSQRSDIAFYSLQKNSGQWDCSSAGITDHTDEFNNFSDTAAFIEHLDLVISVDTAVAHLAAAMGKPTWVLIAADFDWRWFAERHDCPWYPSVRLFRQCKPGDWGRVLEEVNQALSRKLIGTTHGYIPAHEVDTDPNNQ
jgi:tetratricopeptide (TPR) repeat protein